MIKLIQIYEQIQNVSEIKFNVYKSEDYIYITALHKKKVLGKIVCEEMTGAYWDESVKIEHLEVYGKSYKGLAVLLMKETLKKIKKLGYKKVYLNASPIHSKNFRGLILGDLVKFYKFFGFKEILNQGWNVQMVLNLR